MAYGDDIDVLGNSHRYILSADANDSVGTNNGTNTGGVFTGSQICEDTTNSYVTNSTADTVRLPAIVTINSVAQTRKAVCGWFMTTAIQTPPRIIYGEGTSTTNFQFVCAYGNNSMFEVTEPTNFNIQVFGPVLVPNRVYHLCGIFEGSGFANEAKFFVDGVEQTLAAPSNRQPGTADINSRGVGSFGAPPAGEGIGEQSLTITAPINGQYSQWAMFDGANAVLTDTEIREELFEKGALPFNTITAGTEAVMQAEITLDEDDTVGTNVPNDIRISTVTGDGDLTITLDNRTFDPLSSIHIQYMGTGTLTIINTNGSNASIGSTPNGGTIIFATQVAIQITCKDASTGVAIEGARVYVIDSNENIVLNDLTNVSGVLSGTFNYIADDTLFSSSRVRKGTSSPYYKTAPISGVVTINGLTSTILMIKDE